jgi:hypothetical protein
LKKRTKKLWLCCRGLAGTGFFVAVAGYGIDESATALTKVFASFFKKKNLAFLDLAG